MDVKKLALLVGALVIAVITAVMAKNMFAGAGAQQAAAAPAVPVGPKVLVAKKALPVGTIIDPDSFSFSPGRRSWCRTLITSRVSPTAIPRSLLGTVVRYPITAGQPVTRGALVGPQDRGFLAAALGAGMRAITVPVNVMRRRRLRVPGRPRRPGADAAGRRRRRWSGAQGRRDDHPQPACARDRPAITDKDDEGKTVVKTFANVTLEVTPRIAEKIAVAQSLGSLSLSLRSIADNTSDLERAVAAGDVKVPAGTNPADEKQMLLAMANRPIDSNTTFSTGGDVSRFQRRTVPATAQDKSEALAKAMGSFGKGLAQALRSAPSRPFRSCVSLAAIMSPLFRWELANMKTQAITRRARLGTAMAALALRLAHWAPRLPHLPSRPPPSRRRR